MPPSRCVLWLEGMHENQGGDGSSQHWEPLFLRVLKALWFLEPPGIWTWWVGRGYLARQVQDQKGSGRDHRGGAHVAVGVATW